MMSISFHDWFIKKDTPRPQENILKSRSGKVAERNTAFNIPKNTPAFVDATFSA
jgi:hypothetical protein